MFKRLVYIFIFGFFGSLIRLWLTTIFEQQHFVTVMAINVSGSFLLALVTGALPFIVPVSDELLSGLSVGLIGSFTTFSTFCVDTVNLATQQGFLLAASYWAGSLFFGILAAVWGVALSHRAQQRRLP